MELVKLTLIGFVLGITAIIPGISVATMAVAFNVYDKLINVIVPNVKKIFSQWLFWLPMIIGGILGLFFASKIITILFENFRNPTYWFFIGIIAGSLPLIYTRVQKESSEQAKITLPSLPAAICAVIALAVIIVITMINPNDGREVYTELSFPVFWLLVLAGALGAIAMIVPGISGAFVLLVLGFYRTVLLAVDELNFLILVPVILGAIIGLLLGAALVRFLLLKVPRQTYGAVLGLVAGSVFILYPGCYGDILEIIISAFCLLSGFTVSFLMGRRKKTEN